MYLLIDNYDSFTYNLYQTLAVFGGKILIKRNDEISLDDIRELKPDRIIISPGPKTPDEAGISNDVIKEFGKYIPILGICLGHQCIAQAFGGRIQRVDNILHGRTSLIRHNGDSIFSDVPSPFPGARYHSLHAVDTPECLEKIAWTDDGLIMGVRHREWPVVGLQFRPESFLTENGTTIIKNFIRNTI